MTTEPGVRRPATTSPFDELLHALTELRAALATARFELRIPSAEPAIELRTELVNQLDDYLLPRLRRLGAPLLTVVGGSTGAGKSTVVNSLVRAPVSPAGVLRPTTRSPVLACHPYDLHWFSDDRVLPELTRTSATGPDQQTLRLVSSAAMDPGLAFVDAPDIDSVVVENRRLAHRLQAAADLWLFVTTPARYSDAVPWEALQAAQSRGTALAVLLDRVPPGAEDEVRAHLREMLQDHRLGAAPLFVISEVPLVDGMLPEHAVTPLRGWFSRLAGDPAQRAAIIRNTLDGAMSSLRPRVKELIARVADQVDTAQRLREDAGGAYAGAQAAIDEGIRDGALLRGDVLARWEEFVGTGELTDARRFRIGRWRNKLTSTITGTARHGGELEQALRSGVVLLVDGAAERAAGEAAAAWRSQAAGADLLRDTGIVMARSSPGFRATTERMVQEWQAGVLDLVRRETAGSRTAGPVAGYGVNGVGLLVMIVVFAAGGGTAPRRKIAEAGGTTMLTAQKVLQAVSADQTVRRLAAAARVDLLERVGELLADERERYDALLTAHASDPGDAAVLEHAAAAVERVR